MSVELNNKISAASRTSLEGYTTTIFEKEYHGFEDAVDVFRDVSEAFDGRFNPAMKDIPGEFQGTMRITITYERSEDDPAVRS